MELFCLVTDTAEAAGPDDSRWLDAAIDVLEKADEPARFEMRDILTIIDKDYLLNPPEQSRLRSATATIPGRAELTDLELGEAELREHVMSILLACRAYRVAYESLTSAG
ncbi:MAG: hypothetical protein ACRCYQ_10295 [Nocardioides sp.]